MAVWKDRSKIESTVLAIWPSRSRQPWFVSEGDSNPHAAEKLTGERRTLGFAGNHEAPGSVRVSDGNGDLLCRAGKLLHGHGIGMSADRRQEQRNIGLRHRAR